MAKNGAGVDPDIEDVPVNFDEEIINDCSHSICTPTEFGMECQECGETVDQFGNII